MSDRTVVLSHKPLLRRTAYSVFADTNMNSARRQRVRRVLLPAVPRPGEASLVRRGCRNKGGSSARRLCPAPEDELPPADLSRLSSSGATGQWQRSDTR